MDKKSDIQIQFFDRIRDQMPQHVSMVDEIADILGISNDSAYRRIRAEKQISLYELQKLSSVFHISIDDLTGGTVDTITFRSSFLDGNNYPFSEWLRSLLKFTIEAGKMEHAEAIFILNELNIFHLVQFPEVCAFKLFFWQKSNLDFSEFRDARFTAGQLDEEVLTLSKEIAENYVRINTIEFTTPENLNSFLKQVVYYSEAGYFKSREDALKVCSSLHELVSHQHIQAESGFKFLHGNQPAGRDGNFRLYLNEMILADNTIIIRNGDSGTTFLTSNAINLMQTQNRAFFEYNYKWAQNLLSKSVPISGTSEKERNRFFRSLHDQIDKTCERI